MRFVFDSQGLRPFISKLMSYPDVSELWNPSSYCGQDTLLLTMHLQKNDLNWQFFSTIATLGTPYDITLQEIRIECFFPADAETESSWSTGNHTQGVL